MENKKTGAGEEMIFRGALSGGSAVPGRWRAALAFAVPALLTALTFPGLYLSARAAEGSGPQGAGLQIQVVEELSIDDEMIIEDEPVPLAMFTDKPAQAGPRHAAAMGLVLAASIGYTVYFDLREKKLFALRREAALAQKQAMETEAG